MSDSSGPYDPNAIEGEKPAGSQYISLKDVRIGAIFVALLSVPCYFVYKVLEGNSERHRCIVNLGAVYEAINLYAGEHDNRFPPIARTDVDGYTPTLGTTGKPYTWVSDVGAFMTSRASFLCPTAEPGEVVHNESATKANATVPSAYGMYEAYGGVLTSLVESPDDVVLVSETSTNGAKSTLDSKPFGTNLPDGFAIGWSDSNSGPTKTTQSVTRLAFPGSSNGTTKEGRHGTFVQALTASGKLIKLAPDDTTFGGLGSSTNPHWKVPPGYRGPGE